MSYEFAPYSHESQKTQESLIRNFISHVGADVPTINLYTEQIFHSLLREIWCEVADEYGGCSRHLNFWDTDSWSGVNDEIRAKLCLLCLSILRCLIQDALGKIKFPKEGALDKLKERIPILFADWDQSMTSTEVIS
ncbi:hypothetical protein [Shimazuella kribbensis]|uniref:hypothetical protein n=1 Tax=Shimazuella kribbensis TaxID=139808 RepID=UPI0004249255|nr:hypothetical protein [Shimazuella kribbensis]